MPVSHSPISQTLLPPPPLEHYRVSKKLDDVQANLTPATSSVINTKTVMAEFRTEAVSNAEATAAQLTTSVGKLETSDAQCTMSTERFNAVDTNVRDMNASFVSSLGGLRASIHTKIPPVRVETKKIGDHIKTTGSTLSTIQHDIDQVKGSLSDIKSTVEKYTDASTAGFDNIGNSTNDIHRDLRDARDRTREEMLAVRDQLLKSVPSMDEWDRLTSTVQATKDETCDLSRGFITGINSLWTKKIKPLGEAINIRDEEMSDRIGKLATRVDDIQTEFTTQVGCLRTELITQVTGFQTQMADTIERVHESATRLRQEGLAAQIVLQTNMGEMMKTELAKVTKTELAEMKAGVTEMKTELAEMKTDMAEMMKRMDQLINNASQPRQQEDTVAATTIAALIDTTKSLADASHGKLQKDALVTSTIAQLVGSNRKLVDSNRQLIGAHESFATLNKTLVQTNYISATGITMGVLAVGQQAQHLHIARDQITELTHEKRSLEFDLGEANEELQRSRRQRTERPAEQTRTQVEEIRGLAELRVWTGIEEKAFGDLHSTVQTALRDWITEHVLGESCFEIAQRRSTSCMRNRRLEKCMVPTDNPKVACSNCIGGKSFCVRRRSKDETTLCLFPVHPGDRGNATVDSVAFWVASARSMDRRVYDSSL